MIKPSKILASLGLIGAVLASAVGSPMEFKPLPYSFDALEPHIDAKTMEIHFSRHHKGYFDNLMRAIDGTELADLSLEAILAQISKWPAAVRNNAGGHYNHDLFWNVLSPNGGGEPEGDLADAIVASFGSFSKFKRDFKQAALTQFGSGWAWLALGKNGTLFISATANQDNPLMDVIEPGGIPVFGIDVWEHAYYLNYQNRRGSYIDAFWNVVDWNAVAERYRAAKQH